MVKKVGTRYTEMLWGMLTQGATRQLENRKEGDSGELITNFSPNNVRRVILGLDGMFVQFYTNEGTGVTRKLRLRKIQMDEVLMGQLCDENQAPNVYMPLDMLHKQRMFSSVEEIIVLGNDGVTPYTFVNSGIEWFSRDAEIVAKSFKRLRCVTYLDISEPIESFIESVSDILEDPLVVVTSVLEDEGKFVNIINDEKYVIRTSLRPQYYAADALGGTLANYFESVKKLYEDEYKRKLLAGDGKVDEKGVLNVDVLQAVFDKFLESVLPRYDKEGVLEVGLNEMARLVATSGVEVDVERALVFKGSELRSEHKQYGVLVSMLFNSGLDNEEVAIVGIKVLLEQLDACSKLVRKHKLTGVMPKMKSLGLLGKVIEGVTKANVVDLVDSVGMDFDKYLDIYERIGTLKGSKGVVEEADLTGLDVDLLNKLGQGVASYFGYEFTQLSEEELEKLARIEKEKPIWVEDIDKIKNLVGTDLTSRDILGNDKVLKDLQSIGVVGFLGYAVKYNVEDVEDLINLVVVKRLNEGTDLALEKDISVADLAMKVITKRDTYKGLVRSYTEVRDKLSHERLLNYLEEKVDSLDNLGLLLLHDEYVARRFFAWLGDTDATIPLLFAFKNTGDVIYTTNEKLTKDKLLQEVFKDGIEPFEDSIAKLKYMAKHKPPKKKMTDKSKSLNDMFRTAVRKVDGIDE